jgi:hypothetical protein
MARRNAAGRGEKRYFILAVFYSLLTFLKKHQNFIGSLIQCDDGILIVYNLHKICWLFGRYVS